MEVSVKNRSKYENNWRSCKESQIKFLKEFAEKFKRKLGKWETFEENLKGKLVENVWKIENKS